MSNKTSTTEPSLPAGCSFRSPELGDTIRCVSPTRNDTPLIPTGTILSAVLATDASLEYGRGLVASRRWCVVDSGGDK
jgi:hypothetical protein